MIVEPSGKHHKTNTMIVEPSGKYHKPNTMIVERLPLGSTIIVLCL
jgi:hypothetical protein